MLNAVEAAALTPFAVDCAADAVLNAVDAVLNAVDAELNAVLAEETAVEMLFEVDSDKP